MKSAVLVVRMTHSTLNFLELLRSVNRRILNNYFFYVLINLANKF